MATITMPQLGESVTEGTVAQWLKRPGERIEKYEPFVEISTDKVNAEVPSPVAGILRELIVAAGETVPTGTPIAVIDEAETSSPAVEPPRAAPEPAPSPNGAARARLSPAVRRLAREHAVVPGALVGTGAHGRVTAADVIAAAGRPATAPPPTPAPPSPIAVPRPAPQPIAAPPARPPQAGDELIAFTPSRRLIAQRMVESKHAAPHAWTMVEVDVTELVRWRERERGAFERSRGVRLTLLPFFMRAVVEALQAFPLMNASFTEAGIAVHRAIHLGVAVAVEDNLLVPVVRDAGSLSIAGLAQAIGALIARARDGRLGPDDLAGGTFTVNNTGANGSILSAPILVPGQTGIVTMEAVVKRPVVRDDAIAIRSMMNVCLSLDHRVVDGAVASAFLADVRARLQGMGPSGAL